MFLGERFEIFHTLANDVGRNGKPESLRRHALRSERTLLRAARDHVLIGHNVAGWVDNEPGAETLQRLPDLARTSLVIAKELRVKIFDRIADAPPDHALGVDVDDGGQDLRYRQDRGFSGRVSL